MLFALLTGCGANSTSPSTDSSHLGTAGARTLPIQAYALTPEQEKVVYRATQQLADACMRKQGYDVGLPDRLTPPPGGHIDGFLDRRYAAVYDEATARRYGYHVPRYVDVPRLPPTDPRFTPEAVQALFGTDSEKNSVESVNVAAGRTSYGGCMREAELKLAKGTSYVADIGQGLAQPVRLLNLDPAPADDPRVNAAQAAWSACMATKGYQVARTIGDDNQVPKLDLNTPLPSPAEIAEAVTDVHCQQRTKVVDIYFTVESEYELKKINEQPEVFAQIKRENAELVARAAALVGSDVR